MNNVATMGLAECQCAAIRLNENECKLNQKPISCDVYCAVTATSMTIASAVIGINQISPHATHEDRRWSGRNACAMQWL